MAAKSTLTMEPSEEAVKNWYYHWFTFRIVLELFRGIIGFVKGMDVFSGLCLLVDVSASGGTTVSYA